MKPDAFNQLNIDARWLDILKQVGLSDAVLLWESNYGPGRRTYMHDGVVYKMWCHEMTENYNKYGDLAKEYELLNLLKMKNTPRPLEYVHFDGGEMAAYECIRGKTIKEIDPGLLRMHWLLSRLALLLIRLSLKGVAHNDVQAHNVILNQSGQMYMLDFDQASRETFVKALYHNLIGGRLGSLADCYRRLVREYAKRKIQGLAGLLGLKLERIHKPPTVDETMLRRLDLDSPEPPDIDRTTRQVLNLIRYSKVNSSAYSAQPYDSGYHSITLSGRSFKGQRNPAERLEAIPYDFNGKAVLDVGCNQGGMLFELADKIKSGVGVDYDARMINVANRIKSATGHNNLDFYVFDLEKEKLDRLLDFLPGPKVDIVFLLSMCMWIRNWREVIHFCSSLAPDMLFESNGTDEQQREQREYLESSYHSVALLKEQSSDDPRSRNRMLFLCRSNKLEDPDIISK